MIEPIARVRIELREIEPTLWRRVDVPLTSTLLALHDIIQVTVGWTDSHLFEFVVGERVYSEPLPDDELFERKVYNAAGIRLRTLIDRGVERLLSADAVAVAWRAHPEVIAVSLIGSVARAPWKEVPRFAPYRRARVALWHEYKDVDLALWLEHLDSLDGLRRAKARALRTLWAEAAIGIASHQVDVFILEPVTDRYLGRLCDFNACPKGKAECRVPGCGDVALLRQHEGFRWRPESLAEGRAVRLFERATGLQRRATDLPLLEVDAG